jgi:hypothetical protein
MERQRIVRLVVKEVLIGDDNIVIRHSIPIASMPPASGGPPDPSRSAGTPNGQSYLLRKGRSGGTIRRFSWKIARDRDSVAERVGFELTGDFVAAVSNLNTSNKRCQEE